MKKIQLIRFDDIPSTNEYAKELLPKCDRQDTVIIAKKQSGGRGTKGRSFSSNEGGVYLTKLAFYENFLAKNAFLIMARTAVAVCKTLEAFSLAPVIKWANDVYVSDKKICGILIENVFSGNKISSSIVGVGLNVNNELPLELKEIAISMKEALGEEQDFSAVENLLIQNLFEEFSFEEYRSRLGYLGETVTLIQGEEVFEAIPVCAREDGALEVEINGNKKIVFSGEVSLRI